MSGRRVALVTGSSRGLGRAIAERLAADGLAVAVNDRSGRGGPATASGSVTSARNAAAEDMLGFFLHSPVLLGGAVAAGMRERGGGRIVHIDSEVVDKPPPGMSAYVAAKAAQPGLMRSWARELATDGITVNAVAPGFIPTERHGDVDDEKRARYLATVPAGRFGTPDEIAAAVSFFASEDAAFVTGQRVVVDGGRGLT